MARLLLLAKAKEVPEVDDAAGYVKGDYIHVFEDTHVFGKMERLPYFVIIDCPEITKETALNYCKVWERVVDYNVLSADPNTAQYQVEAFAKEVSVSGKGKISLSTVSEYLSNWGATVDAHTTNSVTFTVSLWPMIQSKGFWEISAFPPSVTMNLDNYDPASGVGTITVSGLNAELVPKVAGKIKGRGGTAIDGDGQNFITFTIERGQVLHVFRADVQAQASNIIRGNRYYFDESLVNDAIVNGGVLEVTQAQLFAALRNHLDD